MEYSFSSNSCSVVFTKGVSLGEVAMGWAFPLWTSEWGLLFHAPILLGTRNKEKYIVFGLRVVLNLASFFVAWLPAIALWGVSLALYLYDAFKREKEVYTPNSYIYALSYVSVINFIFTVHAINVKGATLIKWVVRPVNILIGIPWLFCIITSALLSRNWGCYDRSVYPSLISMVFGLCPDTFNDPICKENGIFCKEEETFYFASFIRFGSIIIAASLVFYLESYFVTWRWRTRLET